MRSAPARSVLQRSTASARPGTRRAGTAISWPTRSLERTVQTHSRQARSCLVNQVLPVCEACEDHAGDEQKTGARVRLANTSWASTKGFAAADSGGFATTLFTRGTEKVLAIRGVEFEDGFLPGSRRRLAGPDRHSRHGAHADRLHSGNRAVFARWGVIPEPGRSCNGLCECVD